jgi:nicotinamide N-methyltransferase
LENALASDRERHWKPPSGPESEGESTEGRGAMTRPRSRNVSGVASRNLKSFRNRGDTVTSNRTTNSRGGGDSTDTAKGEKPSEPKEPRTPTRVENPDERRDHARADLLPSPLPPINTGTATTGRGSSKNNDDAESSTAASLDRPRTATPVTPALTPALTGTTDDSDTDFQSAYSATPSPRESLGSNFDYDRIGGSDTLHVVEKHIPGSFDSEAPKAGIVRERVSSIVTAMPQSSPTFSDDTVVSRPGREAVARR